MDRYHCKFIARRTDVRQKVDVIFDGVRLAADQARRACASLTTTGRRRGQLRIQSDLFHATEVTAHVKLVNSVSLQPAFGTRSGLAAINSVAEP